jgi:hypothetical protein
MSVRELRETEAYTDPAGGRAVIGSEQLDIAVIRAAFGHRVLLVGWLG